MGTWDDAFAPPEEDFMLLRREDSIFLLPMDRKGGPEKKLSDPDLPGSRIVKVSRSGERLWLFMESTRLSPFAIDVFSGKKVVFEIPGLKVPGSHAPVIQWYRPMPHADVALLFISDEDKESLPLAGRPPIYFWMELGSGKLVRLPTGWDLDTFQRDQESVRFRTLIWYRVEEVLNLRSGDCENPVRDRKSTMMSHFNWRDQGEVMPLYTVRGQMVAGLYLAGLSYRGESYPLSFEEEKQEQWERFDAAKAFDGFAGFSLVQGGGGLPTSFWVTELRAGAAPRQLGGAVTDFEMLNDGNSITVTSDYGNEIRSVEATFHPAHGSRSWDLMEGVGWLPPLDDFYKDKGVWDMKSMDLVRGSGRDPRKERVLAVFRQTRTMWSAGIPDPDYHSLEAPPEFGLGGLSGALVIDGDGKRGMTDLFREVDMPDDELWMHHSGRLIMGRFSWKGEEEARPRQVELRSVFLRFGD